MIANNKRSLKKVIYMYTNEALVNSFNLGLKGNINLLMNFV